MKSISEGEQRVLNVLLFEGLIPKQQFDITEEHLIHYMHGYVNVMKKGGTELTSSNYRYARKLAGLTLMKYNVSLGAKISEIKAGIVYIIENPAFEKHYKIGMTVDIEDRLNSYQTYDPFRKFKVAHYDFVLNRRAIETQILSSFHLSLEEGEWALRDNCIKVFMEATNNYDKVLVPGFKPKKKEVLVSKRFLNKRELEERNRLTGQ